MQPQGRRVVLTAKEHELGGLRKTASKWTVRRQSRAASSSFVPSVWAATDAGRCSSRRTHVRRHVAGAVADERDGDLVALPFLEYRAADEAEGCRWVLYTSVRDDTCGYTEYKLQTRLRRSAYPACQFILSVCNADSAAIFLAAGR